MEGGEGVVEGGGLEFTVSSSDVSGGEGWEDEGFDELGTCEGCVLSFSTGKGGWAELDGNDWRRGLDVCLSGG